MRKSKKIRRFQRILNGSEPGQRDLEQKSSADNQEEAYLKARLQGRLRRLLCERCEKSQPSQSDNRKCGCCSQRVQEREPYECTASKETTIERKIK